MHSDLFLFILKNIYFLHMITFPFSLSVDAHQIWERPLYWSSFSSFLFLVRADSDSSKILKTKSLYFKITHFEPLRLHTVQYSTYYKNAYACSCLIISHWVININMQLPNFVLQEYGTGSRLLLVLLLKTLFPRLRLLNTQIDLWKKHLWVDRLQVH